MALLYANDDRENPAGSDTTLRDAPPIAQQSVRDRHLKTRSHHVCA